jgi:hypothetical protein
MSEPFSAPDMLPPPPAPSSPVAPPPPAKPSRFGTAVLVLGCLGAGALISRCMKDDPPPPAVVQVVRPTPDVITAVRDLARLETTAYHVERVVDLRDQQQVLGGLVQAEDAILLVAAGDVIAGVDLSKLEPGDVEADPVTRRVRITLPPAEVLSARLDNDNTFVYERETDTLARHSETLETRARQEAERTLRQAAIEGGVLRRAESSARTAITSLLHALGYTDVQVRSATDE